MISEDRALAAAAHLPGIELQGLVAALRKMAGEAQQHRVYCRVVGGDPYPDAGAPEAQQFSCIVETIVDRAIQLGRPHHILVEFSTASDRRVIMTIIDRTGCKHTVPKLQKSEVADLEARAQSVGAKLEITYPAGALEITCSTHAKGPRSQR